MSNIITLNRGDSFDFRIWVNVEADPLSENPSYILQGNDAVYFGVMDPFQPFENALIKRKYTKEDQDEDTSILIHLDPEDTVDFIPGRYYYMIKLKIDHDEYDLAGNFLGHIDRVITITNKTILTILD